MKTLFKKCSCKDANYYRSPRSLWMRFFSSRLLYECSECNARILTAPENIPPNNWQLNTAKPFFVKPEENNTVR